MRKLTPVFGLLATLLPAGVALAVPAPMPVTVVTAPQPISTIEGFIGAICTLANVLFTVLLILAVVVLLVAAYIFLTSGGSEDRTSTARAMLTYAVVGILVALLAKGAVLAVGTIFGTSGLPQCS